MFFEKKEFARAGIAGNCRRQGREACCVRWRTVLRRDSVCLRRWCHVSGRSIKLLLASQRQSGGRLFTHRASRITPRSAVFLNNSSNIYAFFLLLV
jgi:hypothetical protein